MKWIPLAALLLVPVICSCVEYPATGKDGRMWVVPDDYQVDPRLYPKYRAIRDFQPPDLIVNAPHLGKPSILRNDKWVVRHRVGDQLWIYSEEFELRACGGKRCNSMGHHEISIYSDGRVNRWITIQDPKNVFFRGDRAVRAEADPRYDPIWGNGPLFELESN